MRCSFTTSAFSSFVFTFFTTSAAAASADPQAVSVEFGPDFFGYDGAWSAAQIRVGSPEQYLLVFPSTISSETWVAGPNFCDGTSTCATLRGGLFYKENSTTWQDVGEYELGYSALSQTVDNGDYGFDNLSISDTISAANQIFAIVDDIDHWIGDLGLGVQETRFQNTTNHLAFISTLVQNNSVIPSHSYGYTAGASYQDRGVSGSLTLGGVDTSRYTSNNIWFDLASGYIPSAFLRSVEVAASSKPASWASNPITLMSQQDTAAFTIDSSTPYLWMPENVCENIANALNLTWNPSVELYTFSNTTSADQLANLNLHFTFQFANNASTAEQATLVLSFGAFNLQLSYPFPGLFTSYSDAKVNYFPLRRANSTQQYTIGRAFLQETYLTVDYERNVFQLSPALFPSSSQQPTLASIKRPDGSTWPGPAGGTPSTGLSTGAKAGIAAGTVVAAIATAALLWCFCRRRRKTAESQEDAKSQRAGLLSVFSKRSTRRSSYSTSAAELQADKRHPTEMNSDSSNSRYELSAIAPVEMAAAEVPPTFFQERNNATISQRNDPRSPVELVQPPSRSSISKDDGPVNQNRARAESPAPEYSPTDTQARKSSSISPFSQTHRSNPFRASGSENAVSPVTGSDRDRLSHGHHARNGSGSDRILSPVSYSSTQSSSLGQGAAATRSSHLSIPGPMPQRSASRDSRFREDLHAGQTQPSARPADAPPANAPPAGDSKDASRSRFSWED